MAYFLSAHQWGHQWHHFVPLHCMVNNVLAKYSWFCNLNIKFHVFSPPCTCNILYLLYLFGDEVFLAIAYTVFTVNCNNGWLCCLPLDTELPPSYDMAAKLPTYEEAERVKEQQDDLVSYRLPCQLWFGKFMNTFWIYRVMLIAV